MSLNVMSATTLYVRNATCIVWLKTPIDRATGKPQVDDKNANPALAKRPIIGLNIFYGMKSVAGNKWSGTIYNADDGKSYSSSVAVAGPRKLEVLNEAAAAPQRNAISKLANDKGVRLDVYWCAN